MTVGVISSVTCRHISIFREKGFGSIRIKHVLKLMPSKPSSHATKA